MRKLLMLFGTLALISLAIVPVFAQDAQEIATLDAVRNSEELSTFMNAVDAADLVLPSSGTFTIFAPSNEAWEQLSSRLGMTMDELMANPDLLQQILSYHIVTNQYRTQDISSQLDAENHLFLNTLEGSQILVTGNPTGLALNQNLLLQDTGSQIVTNDMLVSNGVVHVIDTVLIPPADVLETAKIRLANFVADAQTVNIYLNGQPSAIQPIAFNNASGWVEVPTGRYEIAFVPVGATLDQALTTPLNLVLAPDSWVTIAATGSASAQTVQTDVVTEDFSTTLADNTARLTVHYDLAEAQTINVLANESIIVTGLQVDADTGGSFTIDLPSGVYDLQFVSADESQQLLLSTRLGLQAQTSNLVTVTGTSAAPEVFVKTMRMEEVSEIMAVSQEPTGQ
jgi:uncharacterized surface protein with fasciclin (FAS1) repeats